MKEELKDKFFEKIEEIDKRHVGTSWDEEDLIELAEYSYNAAMERTYKNIENSAHAIVCKMIDMGMIESEPEGDMFEHEIVEILKKHV